MPTTTTGELRQDLVTDRWVIFAPERADRPNEMARGTTSAAALPEKDAHCPFCIGNEQMVPGITFERPSHDGRLWQTRVVPNKFPVFTTGTEVAGANRSIYRVASNFGRHEVLIETPFHNRDIPFMGLNALEAVINTYTQRYGALYAADESVETIIVFRNHGAGAGTSLMHPHSQIVATGIVPEYVARRERIAADYFEQHKTCVLCDVLEHERAEAVRIISENDGFLSFVPFAASAPCEMWIAPKRHCADFGLVTEQEVRNLAGALHDALQRLHDRLDNPDYNYVVHSCSRQDSFVPHLHWYLQIRPRLTTPAGFEIGSGMQVNHSLPERDAEMLRQE
jgi:UDPglucose--hexose-1-phosphate uridylyltransferase